MENYKFPLYNTVYELHCTKLLYKEKSCIYESQRLGIFSHRNRDWEWGAPFVGPIWVDSSPVFHMRKRTDTLFLTLYSNDNTWWWTQFTNLVWREYFHRVPVICMTTLCASRTKLTALLPLSRDCSCYISRRTLAPPPLWLHNHTGIRANYP
jgi:hypothetical protein